MTRTISRAMSLAGIVALLGQTACTVCSCRVPPETPGGATAAVAPTPAQAVLGGGLKGSAAYNWKNVVILGGGFVSGIVFSPVEKGLVYARTDVGGAYRWDAAGKAWVPLTDQLGRDSNFLGIESLARRSGRRQQGLPGRRDVHRLVGRQRRHPPFERSRQYAGRRSTCR